MGAGIAGPTNANFSRCNQDRMEYPGSWDSLTASLAVCNLSRIDEAWTFLLNRGFVRNGPGDPETFTELVRQEIERGPITGPSIALRVAMQLKDVGIALPAGDTPDPWGKIAQGACPRTNR